MRVAIGANSGKHVFGSPVGGAWARCLAVLIVLFALFEFFVAPRLAKMPSFRRPGGARHARRRPVCHRPAKGSPDVPGLLATWCEPCQQSIPLIQRFARRHPEVDVISVDVGEPPGVVSGFVKHHAMERVALDPDQTAARAFGVADFPTMVVIDGQGNERAKWLGYNPEIEAQMARPRRAIWRRSEPRGSRRRAAEVARPPTLVLEDEPNSLNTIRNTPFGWLLGPITQGYLFLVDDHGALVPDRALALPTRANGGISPDGRRSRTGSGPAAGATARRSMHATWGSRSTPCAIHAPPCPTRRPWRMLPAGPCRGPTRSSCG